MCHHQRVRERLRAWGAHVGLSWGCLAGGVDRKGWKQQKDTELAHEHLSGYEQHVWWWVVVARLGGAENTCAGHQMNDHVVSLAK